MMHRLMPILATISLLTAACSGQVAPESTIETTTPTTFLSARTTVGTPTTSSQTAPTTTTTVKAAQLTSGTFSVPFTMDVPTGSRFRKEAQPDVVFFQVASNDNAYLVLTTRGPDTLSDWATAVEGEQITIPREPTEADIGGVAASYLEFSAEASTPVPGEIAFTLEPGDTGRVYLMTVGGEPLTILALASSDLWPAFVEVVDELLATLTWE